MTAEEQWQHMWELQQLPRTPGFKSPMTPRTQTFSDLEGGHGHYSNLQPEYQQYQHQHGGYYGDAGGVTVQEMQHAGVSPVAEQDEYLYQEGKGKQHMNAY
jgi:hypothetical protein